MFDVVEAVAAFGVDVEMPDQGAVGGVRGEIEPEVGTGRPADLVAIEGLVILSGAGGDQDPLSGAGVEDQRRPSIRLRQQGSAGPK